MFAHDFLGQEFRIAHQDGLSLHCLLALLRGAA